MSFLFCLHTPFDWNLRVTPNYLSVGRGLTLQDAGMVVLQYSASLIGLLVAGLMMSTVVSYLSHSQIWALQEGDKLHVGGRTNRATLGFAGELSAILDHVPDRGPTPSTDASKQQQTSGAWSPAAGPLYRVAGSNNVQQANPGAGPNRNPDYVPNDAAGNLSGSSIGFASMDDAEQ